MINSGLSGTGQEEQLGGQLFSSLKSLFGPKASPHPTLFLSICMFPPLCVPSGCGQAPRSHSLLTKYNSLFLRSSLILNAQLTSPAIEGLNEVNTI